MASLEQNINQVASDFRNSKDAIIAKGVEIADGTPAEEYADKIGEIMSGEVPSVDADKIIPRTISGKSIALKDVSEVPHYVTCKISGVDDPTQVKVKVTKRKLKINIHKVLVRMVYKVDMVGKVDMVVLAYKMLVQVIRQ